MKPKKAKTEKRGKHQAEQPAAIELAADVHLRELEELCRKQGATIAEYRRTRVDFRNIEYYSELPTEHLDNSRGYTLTKWIAGALDQLDAGAPELEVPGLRKLVRESLAELEGMFTPAPREKAS